MTSPSPRKSVDVAEQSSSVTDPSPSARHQRGSVGGTLRKHRAARGLSLRQLARDLGVSASFVSQLENGKSQPSVATLFAICEALEVTVDQVFNESVAHSTPVDAKTAGSSLRVVRSGAGSFGDNGSSPTAAVSGLVVHPQDRPKLVLDTGVTWERLGVHQDAPGEFLVITYAVGGSSTAGKELSRRNGTEYVFVISGQLTLTLGFETYTLGTNDSISFDSSIPHQIRNDGTEPAQAVCFALDGIMLGLPAD